jgi:hypothetical protein
VKTARLSNTILKAAVALLCAGLAAWALGACSSSASPSASSLVDDTFSSRANIESGQVNLALALAPNGSAASSKSLSLRLTGPFQNSAAGKLPRFSLELDLDAAGHPIQAGATATGSRLFIELAGTWFAAPSSTYRAIEQGYAQATKTASSHKARSAFASLGIEPRRWLAKPSTVGTTAVNGEAVYHVTAGVDTAAFLHDVSRLSQSSGALGTTVPGAAAISPSAISELAKSIKSAHVDVYTGKSDHLLRRLALVASLVSTPQTQSLLAGAGSAQVTLDLQLSQINKAQTISPPSKPRPFSELLPALQQLFGALQGSAAGASSLGG